MTSTTGTKIAVTVCGVVALCASWHFAPPRTPPLYDGLCLTDPYRHVTGNPASVPAAVGATETIPLDAGQVPTIQLLADNDNDPQAELLVFTGSVHVPPGSTAVTLKITPHVPPAAKPAHGFVDSNLYHFSITTSTGGPVTLVQDPTIVLRAATARSGAQLEQYDGTTWRPLKTAAVGCADTLEAAIPSLGDFAVISGGHPATGGTASPGNSGALVPIVLVTIVAAALVMVGIRRRA